MSEHLKSVKEPIDIVIPCASKLRKWAFENAYTLIFLSCMFVLTWIITLVVRFV